jgi:hypothetical protein
MEARDPQTIDHTEEYLRSKELVDILMEVRMMYVKIRMHTQLMNTG